MSNNPHRAEYRAPASRWGRHSLNHKPPSYRHPPDHYKRKNLITNYTIGPRPLQSSFLHVPNRPFRSDLMRPRAWEPWVSTMGHQNVCGTTKKKNPRRSHQATQKETRRWSSAPSRRFPHSICPGGTFMSDHGDRGPRSGGLVVFTYVATHQFEQTTWRITPGLERSTPRPSTAARNYDLPGNLRLVHAQISHPPRSITSCSRIPYLSASGPAPGAALNHPQLRGAAASSRLTMLQSFAVVASFGWGGTKPAAAGFQFFRAGRCAV